MEKKFSKIEIAVIKTTAKNAAQYVAMKQKIENQIKEVEEKVAEQIRKRVEEKLVKLNEEKDKFQTIIDSLNTPVKQLTGGYTTEDLVEVKKEATGQIDAKSGKEIFKTVYALKYPETVVPPCTDATEELPTTAEGPGSDYDIDKERYSEDIPEEALDPDPEYAAQIEEAETAFADNNEW